MSTPSPAPRLYSVEQVAEHLGVSQKTVRRWIERDELTTHRFRRQIRISEPDLVRFIMLHRNA